MMFDKRGKRFKKQEVGNQSANRVRLLSHLFETDAIVPCTFATEPALSTPTISQNDNLKSVPSIDKDLEWYSTPTVGLYCAE